MRIEVTDHCGHVFDRTVRSLCEDFLQVGAYECSGSVETVQSEVDKHRDFLTRLTEVLVEKGLLTGPDLATITNDRSVRIIKE